MRGTSPLRKILQAIIPSHPRHRYEWTVVSNDTYNRQLYPQNATLIKPYEYDEEYMKILALPSS